MVIISVRMVSEVDAVSDVVGLTPNWWDMLVLTEVSSSQKDLYRPENGNRRHGGTVSLFIICPLGGQ